MSSPSRSEYTAGLPSTFGSVLDAMSDGIVVVDCAGRLLAANAAAGRILQADFTGPDRTAWMDVYRRFQVDGRPVLSTNELPPLRAARGEETEWPRVFLRRPAAPDGAWISISARPLRDGLGEILGAVAVVHELPSPGASGEQGIEGRLNAMIEACGVLFSSLNLESVLPSVLELARRTIAADAYAIWRAAHPGEWRILCSHGLSRGYSSDAVNTTGIGLDLAKPIVIEELLSSPAVEYRREQFRAEGLRSLLSVPLTLHGGHRCTIAFYSRTPRRFTSPELRTALALANISAAAIGTAELHEEQLRIRTRTEEAERRSSFLAQSTAILGSSLAYETTLAQVARLAVMQFADWCAIDLAREDGTIRHLADAHTEGEENLRGLQAPPGWNVNCGPASVMRTGAPELALSVPDAMLVTLAHDDRQLQFLREAGLSYMCVPMPARGRVQGAIMFVSARPDRRYGPEDLAIAEHLGRRAALAVDNALLYEAAQKERAVAEASLAAARRSEMRLHRLVEAGLIGIILGEGDRITEANDVFLNLLGCSRGALAEGLRWLDLTPPDQFERDARALGELEVRGACTPFEKEYIRSDGTRVPVLIGAVVLDPAPRFTWVAFVVDLTERKGLEERLRQAQKLESVGLLAGGVAHDFNNILTGILGNASLALEDLPGGHPVRDTLENVVQAAERAADLTRQLLAYSGRGRFVIQPVDLAGVLRELIPLIKVTIPKKVELDVEIEPGLPPVEADSSQMQQLIMNLVQNGAEAIGDDAGTLSISARLECIGPGYVRRALGPGSFMPGDYVCVEVADSGCGMDAETLSHIFDPFFTTKFTGRGLGLAAAYGIVRGHDGDIQVSSRVGEGSVFRVLLPAARYQETASAAARPVSERLEGSGTILIADDEAVVLETSRRALERYGYHVLSAQNGLEAVELLRMSPTAADLVLLDFAMPVMGGEEALRLIREIRPELPVIVSSGYGRAETMSRFADARDLGFIQKPYTAAQLAEEVKRTLDGKARASDSAQ